MCACCELGILRFSESNRCHISAATAAGKGLLSDDSFFPHQLCVTFFAVIWLDSEALFRGPGTKISPGGSTVIRNRKFAPYCRSPWRQLLRVCFVLLNISHGPFPSCERSWEEGMCACQEGKKTSSPGKMHVIRFVMTYVIDCENISLVLPDPDQAPQAQLVAQKPAS